MKKTQKAPAESGKFNDVTPLVTLTFHKSVLWVCGTASKQDLQPLNTEEVFMECVNTNQKDKLLIFLLD